MGSDAEIFIFDYARYVSEVVPAFRELLFAGEIVPWMREIIDGFEHWFREALPFDLTLLRNTNLARNCTYLTADLAFARRVDIDPNDVCFSDWEKRVCRSSSCPDRAWCPYHIKIPLVVPETLNLVLQEAIASRCLGDSQFVGRTCTPSLYNELLDRAGISQRDRGRRLLDYLGSRGFVIGYQWSGDGEGIQGWLAPGETRELRDFLDVLPLPDYEPTFENMKAMHRSILSTDREGGFSWEEVSFSFVRTVATIAVRHRKGILWGSDVMSSLDHVE